MLDLSEKKCKKTQCCKLRCSIKRGVFGRAILVANDAEPSKKSSHQVRLTTAALALLEEALTVWWQTEPKDQKGKTGNITREDKAFKLKVSVNTWDKIAAGKSVSKGTLKKVFAQVRNEVTTGWQDRFCVPVSDSDPPEGRRQQMGSSPRLPLLIRGREAALRDLKGRLIRQDKSQNQALTVMRGWPGVGKTTLAAALAHDDEVGAAFPDGVLWVSLGTDPNVKSLLVAWGRQMDFDLADAHSAEEASHRLAAALRTKRMLLIVDDVWQPEQGSLFLVGGPGCATLVTTREGGVAQALAPTASGIYFLPVLEEKAALEVLRALAPVVVSRHREACRALCRELETLPLALQVAGRLLHEEAEFGLEVTLLLTELRTGAAILRAKAPADRGDLANQITPTVAVLFAKSTDRLSDSDRRYFALLAPFVPKPATFGLKALKLVWNLPDPEPVLKTLVRRGLVEPVGEGRFWMHALVVTHALSLLQD